MSGLLSIIVQEARGFVAVPADIDRLAVVIGPASGPLGLSPFFLSGAAAQANRGYGDSVDTLCQIIEQRQEGGAAAVKFPAAMLTVEGDTVGVYGAVDVTGRAGTSVVTTGAAVPRGTYEARIKWILGGTVGTTGMLIQWSL